jgi:NADH dehydrogenase
MSNRPTVAIIGAGFGGLYATKQLAKADVDILLIDRQNFHLFTPLLYQVATSGLEPGEIAYPVRGILRGMSNVRFLLGSVEAIDPMHKTITVKTDQQLRQEAYDYLIVAAGTRTHYYRMENIEQHAFGLKSLANAVVLRNHLLKCFESAAWIDVPAQKRALTTTVVVGGGPTGLETAGALRELYRYVLDKEYAIPEQMGRVILVEMQDHLLDPYPERLQEAARKQLLDLGVEVILGHSVVEADHDHVRLSNGHTIRTHTLVWAAGVQASPVAKMLGMPLRPMGRVPVLPTLQTAEQDAVYAVGDMAYLEDENGEPYPMLIPVAKQQGMLAAKNIIRRLKNEPQRPFTYKGFSDRGIMATIGRSRAVAWIFYRIQLTGFLAWLAWLGLHLITLMGFRNRLNVFVNWVWNYLTYDRSVRIILEHQPHGTFANGSDSTPGGDEHERVEDRAEMIVEFCPPQPPLQHVEGKSGGKTDF